jgi:hypothetical protein
MKTKKFRIFAPIKGEKGGCSFGKTRIVEPKGRDSRKIHDEDGTLKTENISGLRLTVLSRHLDHVFVAPYRVARLCRANCCKV